ncbi:MAG: hypothetical protein K2R98_34130 [Gemmataceae bacterium]|nr:hypothetical protein [Gemmataceae bacterium]
MRASLRVLLDGIIDYAGLFPPAQLPLDQAIRNFASYRKEAESWMLGRFICPVARFNDLEHHLVEFSASGQRLPISALGTNKTEAEEFAGLFQDVLAVLQYQQKHAGRIVADGYEVRLPEELIPILRLDANLLGGSSTFEGSVSPVTVYCEGAFGLEWRSSVPLYVSALATDQLAEIVGDGVKNYPCGKPMGFKLRCGGLEASAFPAPKLLAFAIAACRDANVPMKFTAGLHHPIRHFNTGVQTHMHGFLNVFVGGVLAHACNLSEEQVLAIIEDEDATSFTFEDAGLRWKDHRASTEEILKARQFVTSFGSCSFDEPRDDLRALGWL